MTENIARQPQGIPAGGQFAATAHAESNVSLAAPARRPELEGWPANLPEPEVTFVLGDDNVITTNVEVNGETAFEVWNPGDDVHSTETSAFEMGWAEDDVEAAENWAKEKHQAIADELRAEIHATVERSRARVLAKATGVKVPATDDELSALIDNTATATSKANRDLELASLALASRRILEKHPDAAYAQLQTSSWDNGVFIDGAIVKDSALNELADYSDQESNGEEVAGLLANLNSEAANSHWAGAFALGNYDDELYTVDIRMSSAWTPGDEA
jgi:hypothetical protein